MPVKIINSSMPRRLARIARKADISSGSLANGKAG